MKKSTAVLSICPPVQRLDGGWRSVRSLTLLVSWSLTSSSEQTGAGTRCRVRTSVLVETSCQQLTITVQAVRNNVIFVCKCYSFTLKISINKQTFSLLKQVSGEKSSGGSLPLPSQPTSRTETLQPTPRWRRSAAWHSSSTRGSSRNCDRKLVRPSAHPITFRDTLIFGVTLTRAFVSGIDLENIVYYKDDTHYFVMTAKKQSLLEKGVILQVTYRHGQAQAQVDSSGAQAPPPV